MAKKFFVIFLVLSMIVLCTSCSNNETSTNTLTESNNPSNSEYTNETQTTISPLVNPDPEVDDNKTQDGFSIVDSEGNEITSSTNVYTITNSGEYTITGKLEDGQVVVSAGEDDKVTLSLKNTDISCSFGPAILVTSADKVKVSAQTDTYNTLYDNRDSSFVSEENYDGCIYSECDLDIQGNGTLIINSTYENGIKTKDDLEIKNLTLKVSSVNNALKGNDSITILSGNLTLISTDSDCVKTSNSDVSSKNVQRGIITISGGNIDIYSSQDGISASYDVVISGDDTNINIFTDKYSDYANAQSSSGSDIYLIVPYSSYSTSYDYYLYLYNDDSTGVYQKLSYDSMVYSGRTQYYGLKGKISSDYSNFMVYVLETGITPNGTNYTQISSGNRINTNKNAFVISVSGSSISGDWATLSKNTGSNSNKSTYSSKAIKAGNSINIINGTIIIQANDDGLHANMDTLENGNSGLGNITIDGGTLQIKSSDDGMHADNILNINEGYINVIESHEGLEANVINVNGGFTYVYANDDGLNAFKGSATPLINITGGYLDVTTSSGDTDGIDSNGNITISGGFTIVKGGSASGNVAGSVDVDGTIKVTDGTIVALGGICETPTSGSVNTYIQSSTSFSQGDYLLKDSSNNELLSFTLDSTYSSIWISSSLLSLNTSYTLYRDSTSVLSWTQSSSTVGSSNSSWPGGRPGGRW